MYKQVIVVGCAKGGTTATAGVCRLLGVHMGEPSSMGEWANYQEDLEFIEFIRTATLSEVVSVVQERNAKYTVWGVKHPDLAKRLGELDRLVNASENPYIIFVWRDVAAIVANRTRDQHEPSDRRILQEAKEIADDQARLLAWYGSWYYSLDRRPLFVSYEKLLTSSVDEVSRIANYLEIPLDSAAAQVCREFLSVSPGYQDINPFIESLDVLRKNSQTIKLLSESV